MVETARILECERKVLEEALDRCLPARGEYPRRIHEAIRYSALNGGKRLRPTLTVVATRALGSDPADVLKAACAIEYVHCCSLVLDDLPSMDDATMRRSRPTTHRAFGVATAILAADALLMHAFKLVADNGVDVGAEGGRIASAVRDLATAVGSYGMVGGQHVDLEVAGMESVDSRTLEYIQSRKTGALFVVASTIGGTLLGASPVQLGSLAAYSRKLGLAYQIVDDILDAEGEVDVLGKDVGQDANRTTFVTVHGIDAARAAARNLIDGAKAALEELDGDAGVLAGIADYCLDRSS
jgi:geranylgeranyl diphosphate synthase type II